MSKAGWKKAKKIDQVDAGLAAMKSSSSEVKHLLNQKMDSEYTDLPTRKKNKLDPLTEYLGCQGYYASMRWEWFKYEYGGVKYALEVSRYYQEKSLAMDIAPVDRSMIELKISLLKRHNINYVVLDSVTDLKNVLKADL